MNEPSKESSGCISLVIALFLAPVASHFVCVIAFRNAIGAVDMNGATFGVSPANYGLVVAATFVLTAVTVMVSLAVFCLTSVRYRWTAIIAAILVPCLGAVAFAAFLVAGLG